MSVRTIWVLCEPTSSGISTPSLELLTAARSLADRVEAITWGTATASNARGAWRVWRQRGARRR